MSKPEDAAGFASTAAQQHPGASSDGGRVEVGNAASSRRHPPHASENDQQGQVQQDTSSAAPVPTLPANASGKDKITTAEHDRGIDDESMYDRRPGEDKNQPPSEGAR